jgi:uncharacterized membrane protein YeaQ/YmgE (transglycosylase-associated protein family)
MRVTIGVAATLAAHGAADSSREEKEDEMFTLLLILADGVTIQLGDNVWTFGLNFIIYLIVAAVVGLLAESLVGGRLPLGFIGAIIAALIGAWLLTKVIIINGIGDINVFGVPIFRALVGAIILVAIWKLLTSALSRGRSRNAYPRG